MPYHTHHYDHSPGGHRLLDDISVTTRSQKRQRLIDDVKAEYARRADRESRENFAGANATVSPEAYYEKLLADVIGEIEAGNFDHCSTGREVVEAVANRGQGLH